MNSNITKSSLILLLTFLCFQSFAQTEEPKTANSSSGPVDEDKIYDFVDEPADFPGGREALLKYLSSNTVYPDRALKNKIEGKCYIQFVVTDLGEIANIKIKRGVPNCPECDAEAIRALERMPKWTPGKVNGKNVNSTFSLPITFKL